MATLISDEQLQQIIMHCKNEDTTYPPPSEMLNQSGTPKYAYVTLVMLTDVYVAGAITLAHSIRRCGGQSDLVCLVTPDITQQAKTILGIYFNHVIEVPYFHVENFRVKKQGQIKRKYLELVFTKFNLFNLTQYKKVLLCDADALILKHPDHLFTLEAPAGCFLENKDLLISYDKAGNYISPPPEGIAWFNKMCDCCGHNRLIPKEMTDRPLKSHQNSGIANGLVLLEPKEGEFEKIKQYVSTQPMKHIVEDKFPWPEQQALTTYYSGKWRGINLRFLGLQGYPHWKVLFGLQYGGDKPFVMDSKAPINVRVQYPDFILWHEMYGEILGAHPLLKTSPVLKQANEMHKFFHTAIHLQRSQMERTTATSATSSTSSTSNPPTPTPASLSALFGIGEKRINPNHLKYYFLNRDVAYVPNRTAQLLFDDVNPHDYFEPVKRLAKYYGKNSYYHKIINIYSDPYYAEQSSIDNMANKRLDTFNRIDPTDKDLIMLEYVRCRPNLFVLTFWPAVTQVVSVERLLQLVEKYGPIYYVKTVPLTKNGLYNLMYLMYDEFTFSQRSTFIKEKIKYVQAKEVDNLVTFIFLDNIHGHPLSGQGSKAKKEIRGHLVEALREGGTDTSNMRGNDLIHINDCFFQTCTYAETILNDNSLKLLDQQNVEGVYNPFMSEAHFKIQTFRKWLFENLSPLERSRALVMGGVTLYSYGMKKSGDIDAAYIAIDDHDSQSEQELAELINTNFNVRKTSFFFVGMEIEKSKWWREDWDIKNKKLFDVVGISSLMEIATNPRYHYWFQNMKCYLITIEFVRKLFRDKYHDRADFLMICALKPHILAKYVYFDKEEKRLRYFKPFEDPPILGFDEWKEIFKYIGERYMKGDVEKMKRMMEE